MLGRERNQKNENVKHMIKNIENLTAEEYLKQQLEKGKIPICPIRAGEDIDFSPNKITINKVYKKGIDK